MCESVIDEMSGSALFDVNSVKDLPAKRLLIEPPTPTPTLTNNALPGLPCTPCSMHSYPDSPADILT